MTVYTLSFRNATCGLCWLLVVVNLLCGRSTYKRGGSSADAKGATDSFKSTTHSNGWMGGPMMFHLGKIERRWFVLTRGRDGKKAEILVISDEVYAHLTFGSKPFVPMVIFGSVAHIVTVGSISKRWIFPDWRLGWLVTNDPIGILTEYAVNLHLNLLEDIEDDLEFGFKMDKEESLMILPGKTEKVKAVTSQRRADSNFEEKANYLNN
ncbi:putative aminotransferase TAT2 [Capsicum baccatum]|uniref:Aminotransferase TAT2 n=1 Tax=Capsicum baccatum TaxID=33114 RepID=A0A2G2X642_CAPBA|nr:putative aminotransferase TAT2 [Capsicum baccatum]